jgi:hypothetical protein
VQEREKLELVFGGLSSSIFKNAGSPVASNEKLAESVALLTTCTLAWKDPTGY